MAKRGAHGHFLPGASGNPQGRKPHDRAISEWARDTVDKKELVAIFVSIARGQPLARYVDPASGKVRVVEADQLPDGSQVADYHYPTTAERLRAAEYLWDRIEPPTKSVDLNVGPQAPRGPDFSNMTDSQLEEYAQLSAKMIELQEAAEPIDVDVEGDE